jgi:trigger factor
MRVDLEPQPKGQIKLTVEISPEEMQPYLEKAAESLSATHKIPGFRPGKASLGIVIQKLGATAVWEEASELAVRKTLMAAIRDKQINAVGSPHVHLIKLAADNPLIYTAELAVLPEVTVGDFTSFKSKPEPVNIPPAKVDAVLTDLQRMFAAQNKVERPAKDSDRVDVDFDLLIDGQPAENGSGRNQPVVIGAKQFIPGFEEQLIGLKAGEVKDFSITFPADYHHHPLAGKKGDFKVTVKTVYQIDQPALDDEFAKKAGKFTTLGELRAKMEENLKNEAADENNRRFERAIIDELISRSKFGNIPEMLINGEVEKMVAELKEEVSHHGGPSFDDYLQHLKKSVDDLKKEFQTPAIQRVKAALIVRAIAKQENVVADDKQVEEEVRSTLKMYEGSPDIISRIDSEDYRDYVRSLQINRKVVELLRTNATKAAA